MKILIYLLLFMLGGAFGILALSLVVIGNRADEQTERLVKSAGLQ